MQRSFAEKRLLMRNNSGGFLFSASCAIATASIAITLCIVVGLRPVDGWTLAAMVAVSVIALAGILHVHKEGRDGQERKS